MILTCPNCETRFLLASAKLGAEGRRVKCSNCSHIWLQRPEHEDEDIQFSSLIDTGESEPSYEELHQSSQIPDAIQPNQEAFILKPVPVRKDSPAKQAMAGYGAAACLFLMTFAVLIGARHGIAKSWPASRSFYDTIGFGLPAPGEGLAFDELIAKSMPGEDGQGDFIEIAGRVVNSSETEHELPPVSAILRGPDGKMVERWMVEMPEKTIGAGQAMVFNVARKIDRKAVDVRVAMEFWPSRTAGASGDNNQVHSPDDQSPPHASAEGAESPAHASAPTHQGSSH